MKSRIFVKLFVAALVVIAACTISLDLLIGRAWENMLRSEIETSLRQKTMMFASRVAERAARRLLAASSSRRAEASGARITVIDSNGKVLADSEADAATHGEPCDAAGVRRSSTWAGGTSSRDKQDGGR